MIKKIEFPDHDDGYIEIAVGEKKHTFDLYTLHDRLIEVSVGKDTYAEIVDELKAAFKEANFDVQISERRAIKIYDDLREIVKDFKKKDVLEQSVSETSTSQPSTGSPSGT